MTETQGGAVALPQSPFKLFSLFATAVTLAVALSAAYGLLSARQAVRERAVERNQVVAQMVAYTVQQHFDSLLATVGAYADQLAATQRPERHDVAAAETLLASLQRHNPHLLRVALYDPDGTLWAAVPPGHYGENFAARPWYRLLQTADKPLLSSIYVRQSQPPQPVIAIVAPVRDAAGATRAYLVAQQDLRVLDDWLAGLHPTPHSQVAVYDDREQAVAQTLPDFARKLPWQHALRRARATPGREQQLLDEASGADLLSYATVPGYRWSVLAYQPLDDALAPSRPLYLQFVVFGLAMLAALLPLCYWSARTLTRQQASRQAAQRLMRGLIEGSPDPIVALDPALRVLAFNRAAEQSYATFFRRAPSLGADVAELMAQQPPARREGTLARWKRALDGESFAEIEYWEAGAGRQRTYEMRYYPIWGPQQTRPIAAAQVARDMTEREETAERIRRLNLEMTKHNAALLAVNQDLESFSYTVSHDLRAPIRAIDGFAKMLALRAGAKLDDEEKRLLDVVRDNSRTMGTLIDDLLDFSRVGRTHLRCAAIDMRALAVEAWQEVGAGFAGSFELGELPPLQGDRALLKQVWLNLLANAVKYGTQRADARIVVSGTTDGAQCHYQVEDNGVGFDMRYAGKLFGVFQRLHDGTAFEGTGVGLAIVERVVARHGGKVWAEGEPGHGARFHFALPAVQPGEPDDE